MKVIATLTDYRNKPIEFHDASHASNIRMTIRKVIQESRELRDVVGSNVFVEIEKLEPEKQP